MAFCAVCGAPVEGRFCAKCGSPVGGVPPGAAAGPVPSPTAVSSAGLADNAASALCYVLGFITGIIFLVLEPYNKNRTVRFHAFQSIFMSVGLILLRWAVGLFLFTMMHLFSFLFVSALISLACFLLWIYMIIATYQGKMIVLPIVGQLAQQQVK